ncbi:carboxypeptidase regulatory-like domain-containing protein [Noviherbaspirillum malthae]|uniref:carboxypeptidase regulatory-like domain-containing protein n=1 Tax=Noviherbaspirillum malthae TaxID=1260987 RepID=UPI00189097ED|nr:carboxypeptidase regulatory-like domain-containing protein [Noviherbaspirillum malthae]
MKTKNMSALTTTFKWMSIAAAVAGVVACGGGGGDSGPSTTTMSITGTAATGKALDGAVVTVSCASGTGSATANATGGYTVSIQNGQGPCLLTATKGNTVLRSVAPGAGVANVTPLTDLLVEFLATRAGTTPANLLSNANGKALLSDANALNDGQTKVAAFLQTTYGVTLSSANFLTVSITPPTPGATQSASDKDLDLLLARGIVSSNGVPATTVVSNVKTEGQKQPYVAPTGATGTAR